MNRFRKYSRFVALVLGTLALIVFAIHGCQKQKTTPPEKITIAYATIPNAALVHIAFTNNYFKEEGLDATPQPHAFGKPALQSVIDGKADLATVADTPVMFAVMNDEKIAILATIQTSNKNEAIVARQDRGITKPSDLKGKKIAVTLGTTGDFFLDAFLITNGIDRKQVNIIDMKPAEMSAALGTGRVDAVSIWNPVLTELQKEWGKKARAFYDQTIYTETFNIVALRDFANKHPEAIKKVLRALVKAETFAQDNPVEARRLIAGFINTDKAILDETWNCFNFRLKIDQALLVNLEYQTRWAIKNQMTTRKVMPNYLDFIYVDGLLAVKPEAVRIIR